jgi:hypothetical protein
VVGLSLCFGLSSGLLFGLLCILVRRGGCIRSCISGMIIWRYDSKLLSCTKLIRVRQPVPSQQAFTRLAYLIRDTT